MRFILGCLALSLVAGVAVSCGPRQPATGGNAGPPPRPVQVAPATVRSMERVVTATGTLAAREYSTLSAKVPGRLQLLAVDIGTRVRQGDVIAQVEPRDYELRAQQAAAALANARAALGLPLEGEADEVVPEKVSSVQQAKAVFDEAARNRERIRSLSETGIASGAELDTAESGYTVARTRYEAALEEARARTATLAQRRAEYDLARKQLSDTRITAPFEGAVQARPAGIGEYVSTGTAIVTLVQTDPLRLRLNVPERESSLVCSGQVVRLVAEGGTNVFSGRIARLSPALSQQSRSLLVEADVPNPGSLRPGLFARAEIVIREEEQALAVPAEALMTFAGIEKVVTVAEQKAVETPVRTGRRGAGWVEIISGIQPGTLVVLDPAGLRTGQPVAITDPAGAPQTANVLTNSGP